ncbi:tRNA (adenosine(37)-N6)-threonylcarbamoyltransferase complex ATPase subunit type 1 TsaE [Anaerotignum lactatifermentans]|uniref:tRNA threonylcarbamoyladenosine biosynthesis protein TsaE n=1 Tax=Anaerotignum lactatifermentans TaxID=160404 RepID=A0ABS2GBE9_9FIRM|nr:tRNA (adenosine(37)-N6)-threonylcarbamoyltransferase complex ATPase subunit type 1 TsaE [Anaerotignum lactatifermentans]MBM6828673.1 tRNA (adenosine(37)-N6)-threonylcarbamoyltransferase complex ATPase subunit type 1 TsaE [Anaerotignum lactatifermentans]MBM6878804.1 tRNA (adenosine(37)-N6)-threonylcarbamoyltransferase complex ATPase subunit type 1 TsaE [Anaerotignum lactatifermentans]MBM6950255.1 tRNA (adenosine(37)-N6)-threonylcarbamoyltransferase complex ATPase subunit type 1 TsaE [Anaerotig
MEQIWESLSPRETEEMGRKLAEKAFPGQIFCLEGDLGTGKTVFTKGFGAGLGIKEHITSPTFNIVNEYHDGRLPFYHFDVYRISCEEEMDDIGYEEYFFGEGVCLVEWASLVEGLIPPEAVWITLEKDLEKGEDYRRITLRQEVAK